MPRPALVLPALTIAAALITSTAVAGTADAMSAHPAAGHGRGAVNFHSTSTHRVVAPATTQPGVAHLRNTGHGGVLLVEAKHSGTSVRQVAKVLNSDKVGPLLKNYRLITFALPKSGSYTHLTRGTYYFADGDANKFKAAKIETMTVTGKRVNAQIPKSRGFIITSGKRLHVSGTLPRAGYLHVQNHSSALVDFLFVGVDNAVTRAMLHDLVVHPSFMKFISLAEDRGDSVLMTPLVAAGPHSISWVHYRGRSGRYIAAVVAVTKTGNIHLRRGQVRVLNLK